MENDFSLDSLQERFEKLHALREKIKLAMLGEDPQMQREWTYALERVEDEIRNCRIQIKEAYVRQPVS